MEATTQTVMKPRMSLSQILSMNAGFLGIQYSFGLQQANMTPIYSFLGAVESELPILMLAGPVTGLIVQPIIGAMSDKTLHKSGRRTPYFLWGAIICSLMLLIMPFSPTLWFAASVLWIMDAANNVTMEPYRAFVSDKLNDEQRSLGFLTQSAFTSLAQTLAYITPSIFVWFGMNQNWVNSSNIPYTTVIAFAIGALISFVSIWWTLRTTKEIPLTPAERAEIMKNPMSVKQVFADIWVAIKEMPTTMKQLAVMKFFQWYALFCYWTFVVPAIANTFLGAGGKTGPVRDEAMRTAGLLNGENGAFYNLLAFIAAFSMVPLVNKLGSKFVHAACLVAGGIGMWMLPEIRERWMLFIPMIGMGLCWGSVMGNPYNMLAGSLPKERVGVYMGIFNMFIVIPMIIQILSMKYFVFDMLGGKAENVVKLGGVLMICAAIATLFVKVVKTPERG